MARRKPQFIPEPRVLNAFQTATRLGMSESRFCTLREPLEQIGFPKRLSLLNGWDAEAVERWIDVQSGIQSTADTTKTPDILSWKV